MLYDRKKLIDLEDARLAPYAVRDSATRGREYKEAEDLMRLPFQQDRDRILHSRAFRRLRGKTQVFVAHYGDHYRTRLSHSLEVAQVSRDVSRAMGLNEDLAEAVALAHDLGHTPFGHAGQDTLDELMRPFGRRFEHNLQSQRIVERLEQVYPDFPGLNLSFETRQGLMKHQSPWDQVDERFHGASLEAQVVNLADEIAYNNHDCDDGLRSGLITEADLATLEIWRQATTAVIDEYGEIENPAVRLSRTISAMFGQMISDLLRTSEERLKTINIQTSEDVYRAKAPLVIFGEAQATINRELQEFLTQRIYFHPRVLELSGRGQDIIRDLFTAYHSHPQKLPQDERNAVAAGEHLELVVQDYISGMTDEFAEEERKRVCGVL